MIFFNPDTDEGVGTRKIRLGSGVRNMTDLSKLAWKWAADTYSAEFNQLLANDSSSEE